ncbi:hypothetical protein SAMN05421827_106143 [Pedobacter terrae]|uniref:Uncharacterized protein n=2 Tax=Pedobacter terrae TaxID=405671 RepID=A0A1G7U4K4_9SPHI|nr:hypothetical protein SAMN05421827_106143 [Pedobacter terrae]
MRIFFNLALISLFLSFLHVSICFASIPVSSVPPPPQGCLVGSRMYTRYLRNVYVYDANNANNVNEYRYIFGSDYSVPQSCISGGNVFSGPGPSGSGNVQIGCDLDKTDYASTVHNPSYENFTVNCPLDDSIGFLLLSSIALIPFYLKRMKQDASDLTQMTE